MKALPLLTAFLLLSNTPAFAENETKQDFVHVLSEENIRAFLEESRAMAMRGGLDAEEGVNYFKRHLTDKGSFRTRTTYELPGFPVQTIDLDYKKEDFITSFRDSRDVMEDYTATVTVNDIKISNGKKSAALKTTIHEKGRLPWPNQDGEKELLPVSGKSECEQKITVSLDNYIQLADADCVTDVVFYPFDKPLGE